MCANSITCHGHGSCQLNGICVCDVGYAGDCSICDSFYFQDENQECHRMYHFIHLSASINEGYLVCQNSTTCSSHGSCQLDGTCKCDAGYIGNCNQCDAYYFMDATQSCNRTFFFPSDLIFDEFYLLLSTVCSNIGTCNGHGQCLTDGTCNCSVGYIGAQCNTCDSYYYQQIPGTCSCKR